MSSGCYIDSGLLTSFLCVKDSEHITHCFIFLHIILHHLKLSRLDICSVECENLHQYFWHKLIKRTYTFKLNTVSCHQLLIVELESSVKSDSRAVTCSISLFFPPFWHQIYVDSVTYISFMLWEKCGPICICFYFLFSCSNAEDYLAMWPQKWKLLS
jgi:hypothetical protein